MSAFAASAEHAPRVKTVVRADTKSGHLVRSVVVEARMVPAAALANLSGIVDEIAAAEGVEESLVHSVIRAESNYNPNAVSPKGALGMMQLIPATARRFGVADIFNPRDNIQGGVKYLKYLLDYYHGDYAKTVAAYNAGEAAVDKYNGIPPYAETRNYVVQVAQNLKTARQKRAAAPRLAADTEKVASATTVVETYIPPMTSVGPDGRIYYRTP